MYVFIGIETPSAGSAEGIRRSSRICASDNLEQIRVIQESGLWVLGGFIVGFDSDDETIFERQREFIERTAIAWAMAGVLQAPPTTALYDRMKKEGRLIERQPGHFEFQRAEFPHHAAAAGAAGRVEQVADCSVRAGGVFQARVPLSGGVAPERGSGLPASRCPTTCA